MLDKGGDIYAAALEEHIRSTVVATLQNNPGFAGPLNEGKLRVVGALYDRSTAEVTVY
ncbi:hypothetical protein ACIA8G_19445 [Lentzea sp. NPDC051213]|uniref:hypothetical protein n=1 Tax=Lentzea sp. NPDC051213 TaxID=3364126 RepID=UPI0037A0E00A